MGKLIKIILALVALVIVAIVVIPLVIDPNDYREQIQTEVKNATGRDLTIGGDLKLSVFPWIGVEINQVALSNAKGFQAPEFARIEQAEVKVKLLPLLSKQVEVSTVVLKGLQLNLEKNKAGQTNWDDLAKGGAAAEEKPKEPAADGGAGIAAIAIGGLQIEQAQLSWKDASTGEQYTISDFDLHTDALKFAQPMAVDLGMTLESQKPKVTARLEMKGDLVIAKDMQSLEFKGLQLVLDSAGEPIPNGAMKIDLFSNLAADFSGDGSLALNDLKIKFDDTTFTGKSSVTNLGKPAIRFSLAGDTLNVDRYLPKTEEGDAKPAPSPTEAATGAALIPVDTLRALDIVGDISIQHVIFNGLKAEGVKLDIDARNGVLKSTQAVSQFYQGSYAGKTTVDARQNTPLISVTENMKDIQIQPMLADLTGESILSGTANINADVNTKGNTVDAFKANLNGKAGFSFNDGAFKGINIAAKIREAQAALKGQKLPPGNEPNQTDFTEIKGTANIVNGLVKNDDLTASSPLLRVEGKGTADLVSEKIDYALTTRLVGSLQGQSAKDAEDMRKISIPIVVGGTFAQPSYKLDLKSMLAETQKAKIEEKKTELKEKADEKLKEKLGDGAGGLLKKLF